MELIDRLMGRMRVRANRAYWRARYVYLDTPYGLQLRIGAGIVALIVVVALGATALMQFIHPTPRHEQHAAIVAIIALIVAVVAAILAVVLAPQPKAQKPRQNDAPTTEDGQSVRDILGTCWVDDSFILAWKVVGTIPIKGKSK